MPSLNWCADKPIVTADILSLLDERQLRLIPKLELHRELAIILSKSARLEWRLKDQAPFLSDYIQFIKVKNPTAATVSDEEAQKAEFTFTLAMEDMLMFTAASEFHSIPPKNTWDESELISMCDWDNKVVVDIASGCGRQALVAAQYCKQVFCIESVATLRKYIKAKAHLCGIPNIFAIDGTYDDLPLPDAFSDITMAGHVFGSSPETELLEIGRITKSGGMIILFPCNASISPELHRLLLCEGFSVEKDSEADGIHQIKYKKTKL